MKVIEARVRGTLARQKSVLLLGPRQTGKTTLVEALKPDLLLNFLRPDVRQRYERSPQLLSAEVEALAERAICRTPRRFKITPRITAIPWQDIHSLVDV